jgi:hypothetical protein
VSAQSLPLWRIGRLVVSIGAWVIVGGWAGFLSFIGVCLLGAIPIVAIETKTVLGILSRGRRFTVDEIVAAERRLRKTGVLVALGRLDVKGLVKHSGAEDPTARLYWRTEKPL